MLSQSLKAILSSLYEQPTYSYTRTNPLHAYSSSLSPSPSLSPSLSPSPSLPLSLSLSLPLSPSLLPSPPPLPPPPPSPPLPPSHTHSMGFWLTT